MEEIYNKIKECNEDEEIIGAYDAEWHRSELERLGRIRAEKQGIEEGIEQGIEKVAKNLLKENIDIETISKVTGLSIKQIKNLNKKDC